LRQGDAITPLLFNVVLETAIRRSKVETREIIFDKRSQIMSPADGGVIVRRRLQSVKKKYLHHRSKKQMMGLEINKKKRHNL